VDLQSGREMVIRNDVWDLADELIPCFRGNDSVVLYLHTIDKDAECEAHVVDLNNGTVREVHLQLSPASKSFASSWSSHAGAGGNILAVRQVKYTGIRRQALMVFNLDDGREIARWKGGCTEEVAVTSDGRYVITDEFP
jgi:hypothetical protein